MTPLDDVWAQLKEKAGEYAERDSVPSYAEAHAAVAALLQGAYLDPQPGPEVLDFYARELLHLLETRSRPREVDLT